MTRRMIAAANRDGSCVNRGPAGAGPARVIIVTPGMPVTQAGGTLAARIRGARSARARDSDLTESACSSTRRGHSGWPGRDRIWNLALL